MNETLFGLNVMPTARDAELGLRLAELADEGGYDFVGVQDHPYIPEFLETWTLLSVIGARTRRVRLFPNVLNLLLRPAPMVAKAAASLDLLTGGRVILGLGAGGYADRVAGYGGARRGPAEAVQAVEEAIRVCRLLWGGAEPVSFPGEHYRLHGAQPGPAPGREIPIWLGALKPRLLRLAGRLADGVSLSRGYAPPERLHEYHALVDEGAAKAGRDPASVRRLYNMMGVLLLPGQAPVEPPRPGALVGDAAVWSEEIARARELRMDAFTFWPLGADVEAQARHFADKVIPGGR